MFPYKPGDTYPTTDLTNPMRPCKLISIPSGYIGNDKDWDFAVLRFNIAIGGTPGCGEQPGGVVGWLAWGVVGDSATEGRHGYTYGYPRNSTNQGCGDNYTHCSGSSCREPTIWGWGNTTLNPTASYKLEHTIDATRGQSGAGLYVKEADGTRRVIATNTGCISPFIGADYNYGRRIDSTMASFIDNTSAL